MRTPGVTWTGAPPLSSSRVLLATATWLLLAIVAGAAGLPAAFPPPFPLLVLLGLVVALLGLLRASPRFRAWALGVDIRALVLVHATRFVGAYFLVLHARGELPWAFAVPGGWGDIAVAAAAIAVVTGAPRRGSAGWGTLFVWNVVGFVDITLVVATAARLGMTDPGSMGRLRGCLSRFSPPSSFLSSSPHTSLSSSGCWPAAKPVIRRTRIWGDSAYDPEGLLLGYGNHFLAH